MSCPYQDLLCPGPVSHNDQLQATMLCLRCSQLLLSSLQLRPGVMVRDGSLGRCSCPLVMAGGDSGSMTEPASGRSGSLALLLRSVLGQLKMVLRVMSWRGERRRVVQDSVESDLDKPDRAV